MIPRPGARNVKEAGFSEHAFNSLECMLRAISDIQILLALALAISVVLFGVCRTLHYHFEIGINLLLLACANYLQTLGLTRHYWRSWPAGMAAFLRLLAMVGIYFCFGWMLAIQNSGIFLDKHSFAAERMSDEHTKDSVIFLKAACFLDPDFQNNTFRALDPAERTHIGLQENHGRAAEWYLGLMLAVLTLIAFFICLLSAFNRAIKKSMKKTVLHRIYYALIWLLSMVVFIYSAITVTGLRSWVSKSGWLQPGGNGNPQDDIRGFGQTAALVLMAAMLIGALENASIIVKQTGKQKKVSKRKLGNGKQHV